MGSGATKILKKKLGRDRQQVEEEDFKHLRNEWSYKVNANIKQARRCEQYVHRLELFARNEGTDTHAGLNVEAINGITKATGEKDEDWQLELVATLNKKDINQKTNTMLIPKLKSGGEASCFA